MLTLDKFKEKSADNLLNAIQRSKENDLDKLLFGFGIRNIGDKAAALLAEHFGSLQVIREADAAAISEIDGFGGVMAQSVVEFFAKEGTTDLVHRLADAGVNMQWKGEPRATSWPVKRWWLPVRWKHSPATRQKPHRQKRRQGQRLGLQKDFLCGRRYSSRF